MTSVKYFHSAMTDAPVLNGVAGSLIGVLDACLINGFHLKSVDSIVVASNVATVSISSGHSYEADSVVLIAGATPAGLNGEKRVLSATGTSFTFAATGISDQTATGTISARFAPAGWTKPFSGTNLAVYRSPNLAGTQEFFRIDDTAAQNARLVGYENMTDVNTGTGPFPTAAQLSGGFFLAKANSTATTARAWLIVADNRTVWYWVNTGTPALWSNGITWGFGDYNSLKSGDPYSAFTNGGGSDLSTSSTSSTSTSLYGWVVNNLTGWTSTPRSFTGIGSAQWLRQRPESFSNADAFSGETNQMCSYPNPADNSLLLSNMTLMESNGPTFRGRQRGLYFVPQAITSTQFTTRDKIDGQGPLAGRKLIAVKGAQPAGTGTATVTGFIDITGPW